MTDKVEIKIRRDDFYDNDDDSDFGVFVAGHRRRNIGTLNGEEGRQFMEDLEEGAFKIPVYAYEHSGIALSTSPFSCRWDSGQVGWWVFTSENLVRIYNEDTPETRAKALEGVKHQLSYLNDISDGNVWGYEIVDFDGHVADSCWGFVGDGAPEMMKEHLPENLHASLARGWDNRYA